MGVIKMMLAEDHTIVRQGLSEILEKYEDVCVVAEAEEGSSMVKKYFEFRPDVVLSDVEMPELDGFAAGNEILSKDRSAKIIFISMHNSDEYIFQAYKMGASGMISKSIIRSELIRAIRVVAGGKKYFMNKTDKELEELAARFNGSKSFMLSNNDSLLTLRDKEILELISQGRKSEEIAGELNLSKRTIDVERSKIMAKLNIKTATQLILYAVQHHLRKK